MMNSILRFAAFASVVTGSTTTTNEGGNIIFTHFPVTEFPVPTQTHFDSPSCTRGPSTVQQFTVNYNVRRHRPP